MQNRSINVDAPSTERSAVELDFVKLCNGQVGHRILWARGFSAVDLVFFYL
jgi:hypothetical protein